MLDALGARRLPDPTTAGDFCRRFTRDHIYTLLDVINDTRLKVWAQQPRAFFDRAILDTIVQIPGEAFRVRETTLRDAMNHCIEAAAGTREEKDQVYVTKFSDSAATAA